MTKKPLSQRAFEETANGTPDNWDEIREKLNATEEELLPELEASIHGQMIHHPLLVTPAMPLAENNFLLLARKRTVEKAAQSGEWSKYVFTHARPYQVNALKAIASKMDDKTYWEVLAAVYTESENLRQNQGSIRRLLTSDRPHREAMMSEDEKSVVEGLPEIVTIFRGYSFDNSCCWSWTVSREKAEWFANRLAEALGGIPRVATGRLKKTDIIAYLDGREEKEIVCDPKAVEDITTERIDGKVDKPRVPRDDKLELDSVSGLLKMHMKQNPTLQLVEMRNALEVMYEEVESLIEHHGGETQCEEIDANSVDSPLLRNELREMGDTELGDLPGSFEEAFQDLEELIDEHGDDTLCGDFDLS